MDHFHNCLHCCWKSDHKLARCASTRMIQHIPTPFWIQCRNGLVVHSPNETITTCTPGEGCWSILNAAYAIWCSWSFLWHYWGCKMGLQWFTLKSAMLKETTVTCVRPHSWPLYAPDEFSVVYCRGCDGAGDYFDFCYNVQWSTWTGHQRRLLCACQATQLTTVCSRWIFSGLLQRVWWHWGLLWLLLQCTVNHWGCKMWPLWHVSGHTVDHCRPQMNF